jgi:hypothetical protein
MNPDAASEKEADNKENLEARTEDTTGALEMEVIMKDNLEVSEETRKKKT